MLNRTIEQNGLLDACAEEQKGLIVFSPLAQGLLTDRYLHGIPADSRMRTDGRFLNEKQLTPERLELLQKLQAAAQARGEKLAQLAMHWILRQPAVTSVLIGASKPEQVQDALEMVQQAPLTDADIQEIEQILKAN
jgi:L-glyceraldehyde 3-phosphate reductase